MLVQHLMTPDPILISPERSVAEAGEIMSEKGIRHLPVVEEDRLVGLVTRTSLAQALPGLGTGLTRFEVNYLTSSTRVREVMIADPLLTSESTAAEEAARVMNAHRISSLIVMRDDRPVGIITDTDIFEAMLELLGARRDGVRLTVHLPDEPGALARVSGAVGAVGGNLTAVGGWQVEEGTWGAVLKVQNLDAGEAAKSLEPLSEVTVVDVRG